MKRLIALILCAAMVFTLSACNRDKGKPGEEPEPEEESVADVYKNAIAPVEEMSSYLMNINYDKEMTVGVDTFKYHIVQTVKFFDVGEDEFTASLWERTMNGSHISESNEEYIGGSVYGEIDEFKYKTEMTAEDYIGEFIPAVPIDVTLYDSVLQQEDGNIKLSGATAAEEWLGDNVELTEASGLIELNDEGVLKKSTYYAEYDQGPAHVNIDVSVSVKAPREDDRVETPEDKDSYVEINDYRAPRLVRSAYSNIIQAGSIAIRLTETMTSEAGAATSVMQSEYFAYQNGDEKLSEYGEVYQNASYITDEQYSYDFNETYRDGVVTTWYEGEEPETETRDYDELRQENIDIITYYMPLWLDEITGMELTEVGDSILVRYDFNDDNAARKEAGVSYDLFGDEEAVMDSASDYSTSVNMGYIGIDSITGLPTSTGIDFMGYHTIESTYYAVSDSVNQSIYLGGADTYEEITDEKLPVEEPAEKATPLFYHVTGEGDEEMWLMGTIHLGDARTAYLPDEVYSAFDSSDALAVEVDVNDFWSQLEEDEERMADLLQSYVYSDGTTTRDHIKDKSLYQYAMTLLAAGGEYSSTYQVLKPSLIADTIESFYRRQGYSKLTGDNGVDEQLMARANEQGKRILNVESGEAQLNMLTGFSDVIQEMLLGSVCGTTQTEYNAELTEMYEKWCAGDEAALIEMIADDTSDLSETELEIYNEYNNAMLVERNEHMLEVAKGYLESGDTVFYAVGLAHLLSPNGLVNTLREAGYKVEVVSY